VDVAIGVRLLSTVSQRDKLTERAHKQQQGAIETAQSAATVDREGRNLAAAFRLDRSSSLPDELDDVEALPICRRRRSK